jgi:hypothetical protein
LVIFLEKALFIFSFKKENGIRPSLPPLIEIQVDLLGLQDNNPRTLWAQALLPSIYMLLD